MRGSSTGGTPKSSILMGFSLINHLWKPPNVQKAQLDDLDHSLADSFAECRCQSSAGRSIRQGSILQWHRFSDGWETQIQLQSSRMQQVGCSRARIKSVGVSGGPWTAAARNFKLSKFSPDRLVQPDVSIL